ncbi:MAG: gliding motility lipoprotein GldH [Chitinophagales bacterium]|nr:gliding motility lipoprotein GldH [Chitinophagales bacterium]
MKYILFLTAAVVFTACGPDYLFEEEKNIANAQWMYRDTLDYRFSITDTTALYNLSVTFSYADSFPNQNVYIKFYTKFPDGKRLSKPLSFDLFDPEGKPAGKCSGGICSTSIPIQQNAFFEKAGEYVITLEQFGRQDALPGIKSVGLNVEKTEKKK